KQRPTGVQQTFNQRSRGKQTETAPLGAEQHITGASRKQWRCQRADGLDNRQSSGKPVELVGDRVGVDDTGGVCGQDVCNALAGVEEKRYPFIILGPARTCSQYHERPFPYSKTEAEGRKQVYERLRCHWEKHRSKRHEYYYVDEDANRWFCLCSALRMEDGKVRREYGKKISNTSNLLHTIYTSYGAFTGTRTDLSFAFLGIPYAFPPVGKLRFHDPVCISRITKTWDASYFRSCCPQDNMTMPKKTLNEDCLYVNVFTPYTPDFHDPPDMLLPVMVWIHGGSFVRGDVSHSHYDPSHLVSRENIVVVTFNYRLNIFGFWGSGNHAIKDQITALQWVQKHIRGFGGDPERVTICGESAGAISVRTLIAAKHKTQGLFHAAIMASDPLALGFSTKSDAEEILSLNAAKLLGCSDILGATYNNSITECMRNVSVESLVNAASVVGLFSSTYAESITSSLNYKPVIDGDLLKENFHESMMRGDFVQVPMMIGYLQDEGRPFVPFVFPNPLSASMFTPILFFLFGINQSLAINSSGLYDYYTNDNGTDNVREAIANILSLIAKLSLYTSVYGYYYKYPYTWLYNSSAFCYGHVCHADDILSLLGSASIPGVELAHLNKKIPRTNNDTDFLRVYLARIGSFVRTHNPNPSLNSLCYNKELFYGKHKLAVEWSPFSINYSLGDAPVSLNNVSNGPIYGPLHVLDHVEGLTGEYGYNKTICDFWFKQGIHAQTYAIGGFAPIQYKRNLPSKGPRGSVLLLGVAFISAYGFYKYIQGVHEKRELKREDIWSRIHLIPLLQAELDRDLYRRKQAIHHTEDKIMENVPNWDKNKRIYNTQSDVAPTFSFIQTILINKTNKQVLKTTCLELSISFMNNHQIIIIHTYLCYHQNHVQTSLLKTVKKIIKGVQEGNVLLKRILNVFFLRKFSNFSILNSHIGSKPLYLTENTKLYVTESKKHFQSKKVTVEGPKGSLSLSLPSYVEIDNHLSDNKVIVSVKDSTIKKQRSMWGTARSLLSNMIIGVTKYHFVTLRLVGIGYRASIENERVLSLKVKGYLSMMKQLL
ncbi:hypothetical protein PORY_000210, partial [Pneumocystis oryctolagi]